MAWKEGQGFLCLTPFYPEGSESVGPPAKSQEKGPPYVLPIRTDTRQTLESELFTRSYKGVTDLVTKWLWPLPAFWAVRFCVRFGLRPNHVTVAESCVCGRWPGVAFWHSYYGIGLLMGWLMTFLDTVDGKLARVTVTSSRIGDVLDHGLDIIHPPLWYIAWGVGSDSNVGCRA